MTGIPALLDHVVLAGPELSGLVAWFRDRTGVTAAPGGRHPTGTANALVAFTVGGVRGRRYLELIGPDPDAAATPTTFGIDTLTAPRIVTYAVHPDDIDGVIREARAGGFDAGDVAALSRRTPDGTLLRWRLTSPRRPGVPFLIDWGDTRHPGLGDLPTLELLRFERVERAGGTAVSLRRALDAFPLPSGSFAPVVDGDRSAFRLVVGLADGRTVTL